MDYANTPTIKHTDTGHNAPTCAAIDIGSNTIHLVVARCFPATLEILADEVVLVRIGESVNAHGSISPQKRDEALVVLRRYKELAERHHAHPIFVVATEAIRKAANSADFCTAVREATGLHVQLIDGDVEAILTFYGTTYELATQSEASTHISIMDLGGGSTEFVTAANGQITWRTSLPIGSGWLHDRYFHSDPPSQADREVALTFLQTYLQNLPEQRQPAALIVAGGTANTLLHLANQVVQQEERHMRLTLADLEHCEELLSALPAHEIATRYNIDIGRARILAAGTLIIHTVMDLWQLRAIHVTPHGIREGVLLAYARYGDQWLQQISHTDRHDQSEQRAQAHTGKAHRAGKREESFTEAGRRMLQARLEKMLEWRDAVLRHEDIEAVHKMRVASRRLRAVLDAYESLCEPEPFQKAYRQVKQLADILGKARDTDVMIASLRTRLEHASSDEQAGLQWLIERLSAYRVQHQRTLDTFLRNLDEDMLTEHIRSCLPERGHNGKS
ncbi:MAG: CHAD domain-containing protein [Ktedonobacteraceae bacterium]|nr:CHAD domain-containing protein [Ktedonobacteraceae bacterium]